MLYRLNFEVLVCEKHTLHSRQNHYFEAKDDNEASQKAKQYLADRNESTTCNQEKTGVVTLERIEIQLEPVVRVVLLRLQL